MTWGDLGFIRKGLAGTLLNQGRNTRNKFSRTYNEVPVQSIFLNIFAVNLFTSFFIVFTFFLIFSLSKKKDGVANHPAHIL